MNYATTRSPLRWILMAMVMTVIIACGGYDPTEPEPDEPEGQLVVEGDSLNTMLAR